MTLYKPLLACLAGGISCASAFVLVAKPWTRVAKPWTRVAKPWEDWWRVELNKRVRSSSGQSQNCVRLGTSRDKKCLFQVASSWVYRRSPCFDKENCGHKGFYVRKWGYVQSLAAVVVHISCRNGGRGFALGIISIVQVRTVSLTVHVLTFFNFILFQHWP